VVDMGDDGDVAEGHRRVLLKVLMKLEGTSKITQLAQSRSISAHHEAH